MIFTNLRLTNFKIIGNGPALLICAADLNWRFQAFSLARDINLGEVVVTLFE